MEDPGEGKPAESGKTAEEEMGTAPEEEMSDFCSGGVGPSEQHEYRSFPAEEIKKHYCRECDKSFSCGKALGGHMSSAHAQANKGIHGGKKKDFKNQNRGSSFPQVACRVCGKRFKSNKSLYGHMKNHPNRSWRGVSPPPDQQNTRDPGPHVLAWPVTAKRGRAAVPKQPDIEQGSVHLAAHQLLQLLNSNPRPGSIDHDLDLGSGGKNEFPVQKGLKICERGDGDQTQPKSRSTMILENSKGKAKMKNPDEDEYYSCIKDDSSSSEEDDAENNPRVMFDFTVSYPTSENGKAESSRVFVSSEGEEYSTGSNKKLANGLTIQQFKDHEKQQPDGGAKDDHHQMMSKTMSKMVSKAGSSSGSSTRSKYVGSVRGKRFDNPKAFGGHNKFKISIYNTNGKPTYVASNGDHVEAKSSGQRQEHEHAAAAPADGVEEEQEEKVKSKILDFDLNKSPRCDEEEKDE